MRRIHHFLAAGVAALGLFCSAPMSQAQANEAAPPEPQTFYVFGNSLVHHLTDTDETTVPHWLNIIAQAAGSGVKLDGQWGFLRDFAKSTTPDASWRFQDVPRGWTREFRNFADVNWDAVLITPANFIQYQDPDKAFDGDNPDRASPLSATLRIIDNITDGIGPTRFAIYEGWADMGSQVRRFPPNARQMRRYQRHNAGDYHAWFDTYVTALRAERPETQIDLIPVASVLAELIDGGVLDGLEAEVFYTDDAPHGTPTTYLLAAAITYVSLYQAELPLRLELPDSIHPDVRTYWEAVRDEIHRLVLRPIQDAAAREVSPNTPFRTPDSDTPKLAGLGLADPALAMGLSRISDWGTQQPFIDRMKTARPWIGHLPGQWGGVSFDELDARGLLDEEGWVWGLPEDIEAVETLILTDLPEAADGYSGRYRVSWLGAGDVEITGRGRVTKRAAGEIWFDFSPGEGPVGLKIRDPDPERVGDYVRDIKVIKTGHIELAEAGAIFNPYWISRVDDLRLVRFMDWMMTNGSTQSTWDARPRTTDFSYGWRGVPVEIMVRLANEIAADPWFTMPHLADSDYMRRFATYVRDHLDAPLMAHVEYSNELWNWGFKQAQWAQREGEARWGAGQDVQMQYAGMKAAEMAQVWGAVFGDAAETRLIRVLSTHTGWPGFEAGLLQAPLWQAEGNPAPVTLFEAYGVTGYFGVSLGLEDGAKQLRGWLREAREAAITSGEAQGLKRAALEAHVDTHKHDGVAAKAADWLRQGDLRELFEELLPYQQKVARKHGLALVMYEGGNHAVGVGEIANDAELTAFFTTFASSEEMGELYDSLLQRWRGLGGRSFNAFVDVATPSKWGSWGHLRHLWDKTPRAMRLAQYNLAGPHWGESRDPDTFLHGGIYAGGKEADRLEGTGKRDVLFGLGGNDILIARGPGDLLHGGAGTDRAILPGARGDYTFDRIDGRVRARAQGREYLLTDMEAVAFEAAPALVLPISGLL